jgi:transposase
MKKKIRQVFNIPPVRLEVTQHEVEQKICPNCRHKEEVTFPQHVTNVVQYGQNVQLVATYLAHYQYVSPQRVSEFFRDVYHHSISQGTITRLIHSFSDKLEGVEEEICAHLLESCVIHCDETSVRNQGKTEWVHTYSTAEATIQYVDSSRGTKAMNEIGILPQFTGIAVHDCWKAYFTYTKCEHILCNIHFLRELKGIGEQANQEWANEMEKFLLKAKAEMEQRQVDAELLVQLYRHYRSLLAKGKEANPLIQKEEKSRGRQKQSPARNLLTRLDKYKELVLSFLMHPAIPFDNNQAERDIRPVKLRQKMSGSIRSEYGAANFLRIRSYISTLRKQGKSVFTCTKQLIETGKLELFTPKQE